LVTQMSQTFGRTHHSWAAAPLFVVLALLLSAAPAGADPVGGGANNIVQVSSGADDPVAARSAVQVAPFNGPFVNSTNIAKATATSCTGCRSVAVAFQAIVVGSDPSIFTPGNAAAAVNSACTGCTSFAYAFQVLVQSPGPASLTPDGRAAVQSVADQVDQVTHSGAGPAEMCSQLGILQAAFVDALSTPGSIASAGQPVQVRPIAASAPDCPSFG